LSFENLGYALIIVCEMLTTKTRLVWFIKLYNSDLLWIESTDSKEKLRLKRIIHSQIWHHYWTLLNTARKAGVSVMFSSI